MAMIYQRSSRSAGSVFLVCLLHCISFYYISASTTTSSSVTSSDTSSLVIDSAFVQNYPLYGVLSEVFHIERSQVSGQCRQHAEILLRSINDQDLWAIKALDASGSVRNAFVWGQNAWLGSETQCAYLNEAPSFSLTASVPKAMDDRLIETIAPMPMLYRMVFSNFTSPYQVDSFNYLTTVHRLGICVPSACSDNEIAKLAQSFWSNRRLSHQRLYDMNASVVLVRSTDLTNFTDQSQFRWIFGAIVLVSVFVVVIGSIETEMEFMQCFSLRQNVNKIFATITATSGDSKIGAIGGVRSLICFWVMANHTVFFSMFTFDNQGELERGLDDFAVQPVFTIVLYVEVFFVLSGLLLAYNFVGNAEKVRQIREGTFGSVLKTYAKAVVHRYLRLTPAMIFTVGISHCLALYLQKSTAYYVDEKFDFYCTPSGWWHTVFYVQNLFTVTDACGTWIWYLASDMQFFVIMLPLLYVYVRYPKIAMAIFAAALVAVVYTNFTVCLHFELSPKIDIVWTKVDAIYTPPWMRILPYMVGIASGIALVQLRSTKITVHPLAMKAYWTVVTAIIVASIFSSYFKNVPLWLFAVFWSLGRLCLALCWSSGILVCALGLGGTVNRLLSSDLLAYSDRLTYMMFLLNPVVVVSLSALGDPAGHYDIASTLSKGLGVAVLCYGAAAVTSPIFEIPFHRLSERYLMGKKKLT